MLPGDGNDGAGDHVPVFVQCERDDGLDVERLPVAAVHSEAPVVVELEGHADQRCNGITELFRQIGIRFLCQCDASQANGLAN
ncbi:hypothetical protein D3C87_1694810 [compost metagenome]